MCNSGQMSHPGPYWKGSRQPSQSLHIQPHHHLPRGSQGSHVSHGWWMSLTLLLTLETHVSKHAGGPCTPSTGAELDFCNSSIGIPERPRPATFFSSGPLGFPFWWFSQLDRILGQPLSASLDNKSAELFPTLPQLQAQGQAHNAQH